ncbi:anoctamin-7 isoform X2 [Pseudophryne corroboree]|uniref:anoctamin-7 isoform X2 n=1 Tax=Pseudophryne corroboree TaxID=495146 RepID=UPI003081B8E9
MSKEKRQDDDGCLLDDDNDMRDAGVWSTSHGPYEEEDRVNFCSDGKTQIDFVLVWETNNYKQDEHNEKRQKYFENLQIHGLLLEQHFLEIEDLTVNFMLLSAPFATLCHSAEDMSMRAPLHEIHSSESSHWHFPGSKWFFKENVPRHPPELFTCPFRTSAFTKYLGSGNKETFFTNTQRHQMLYEILARTSYGNACKGEVGVERLLREDVLTEAYPLHDGEYTHIPGTDPKCMTYRQILFEYWASWRKWHKYQPVDHIRKYFGEKIAMYFAWLGLYTTCLLPAAVVGTIVFLVGVYLLTTDIPAKEVCESNGMFTMCPVCTICPYWNLSSTCEQYKAGVLFDNAGTLLFSIFMSIWAVTFLECWKRLNASLSYQWGCFEFQDIEEIPRPEFSALAPLIARNPITGMLEPYFPNDKRLRRVLTGFMVIILMIAVVIMALISVIVYRLIISVLVAKSTNKVLTLSASYFASITGSFLNLIAILVLSRIYLSLAHFLTRWEMHRTQTQYEDAFILKVFIFEFINYYSAPIYIAFFKGRFAGYPGNYTTLFQFRNEECGPGGCLFELAQQLLIIMVGKQVLNNLKEFVIPKLTLWWHSKISTAKADKKSDKNTEKPWERDYKLICYGGLFDEYLEMVIQYGFVTIFVAACPLAPLFAVLNNWIEVRLDAHKFVCEYRRPVAHRAQDIGIWMSILKAITCIAVIANAWLVAFTSDFIPRFYYQYITHGDLHGYINFSLAAAPEVYVRENQPCRYQALRDREGKLTMDFWIIMALRLGFVIIFEHLVFFLGQVIDHLVPDIPESIQIKVKRELYLAKQALADHEEWALSYLSDMETKHAEVHSRQTDPAPIPIQHAKQK